MQKNKLFLSSLVLFISSIGIYQLKIQEQKELEKVKKQEKIIEIKSHFHSFVKMKII